MFILSCAVKIFDLLKHIITKQHVTCNLEIDTDLYNNKKGLTRNCIQGPDASSKVPFLKKNIYIFVNINEANQKGDSTSICPAELFKWPFVKQRCPSRSEEPIFITLLTCQFYSLWDIITYVIKMRTLTVKTRN